MICGVRISSMMPRRERKARARIVGVLCFGEDCISVLRLIEAACGVRVPACMGQEPPAFSAFGALLRSLNAFEIPVLEHTGSMSAPREAQC